MKRNWTIGTILLIVVLVVAACVVAPPPTAPEAPEPAAVEPTAEPVVEPTAEPVVEPTAEPVVEPTAEPMAEPTAEPVAEEEEEMAGFTLTSVMAEAAPVLDGVADDDMWANAPVTQIGVNKGANMGETDVNLQSVYTEEMVYFLLSYADPTESFVRSPWVKQEDGTWQIMKDPDDKGGDNNIYYEDKMAFIWPIDNSIPKFESQGCATACHTKGIDGEMKPYGNKYTDEGMGDIWHWKSVRGLGQIDDQYLDATIWSEETPSAGRHGDPKDGGGYVNNQNEDKTMPMWMGPEGWPKDGSPGYILDSEKLSFEDALFIAGDHIGGITKSAFTGDRGDISAGWQWVDGVWTVEIGRALVTGSEYDVQFNDLTQPYNFGVAVFDNAQVRHAYQRGPSVLVFEPAAEAVAEEEEEMAGFTLTSVMAEAAPVLDGVADDDMWANAPVTQIGVNKGANMGETDVNLQSVYTEDMVYFLLSYADPTESFVRSPWVKQEDGTWQIMKDPDDKGGDNNIYYEDKMAFIWPIDNSIPKFESQGCATACHTKGIDGEMKPYGNKYTDEGMGDIWHWKSVRGLGQIDDQYLDATIWSEETPSAGRHGDPKDGGGYVNNQNEDKTMPMWMGPEGWPKDGSPGYILDSEKLSFEDALFIAGDHIGGITKSAFTGDRGDISAGWQWVDGVWTVEIGRALVTGSEYDVQFNDLTQPYNFGVAVFDNAQVRHAYQRPSVLVFEPAAEAVAEEEEEMAGFTLTSVMAEAAPVLDGVADDDMWANAPVTQIGVNKGANMGETDVNLQSVYTEDMIYFLLSYADPTESFVRSPWVKQEDGTWQIMKDPDDKGGDNNIYYEDKMAFIWPIDNSIPKFESQGCATACHTKGIDGEMKPYGNKYTDEGMGDIWHWKSVRGLGQIDDQYLDATIWSEETPSAGRHGDPKDGGGYVNNQNEDKTMPMWMGPEGWPKDGSPGYILDSEKLSFEDALFIAGDHIGGITKSAFTGDRGDISAGWQWVDGVWTVEIGRALVTGSEYDVQFNDLTQPYNFGVAVFDNAQVRHAYQRGPSILVFEP